MSIYTRWGGECEIFANVGMHRPPYFEHTATLIMVRYPSDFVYPAVRFYWAEFMKADDHGEILEALEAAPKIMLSKTMLAFAFKEVE